MNIVIMQKIICLNSNNSKDYSIIKKAMDVSVIPRINETVCNHMWEDEPECKVADVIYDFSSNRCNIMLANKETDFTKDKIATLTHQHGWEIL